MVYINATELPPAAGQETPQKDRARRLRSLRTVAAALEPTPGVQRYRALLAALDGEVQR
ncbi:hypothetical protein ACIQM3_16895 [Streptomyces sp. NPDC091271]|uniref:hypothetical protein n=1 Tax=Streptomyces sp. NPDC091271 TaxID=3365980 RepID=UPI003829BE23